MKYILKLIVVFLISLALGLALYHYLIMELLLLLGVPCFNVILGFIYFFITSLIIFFILKRFLLKKNKYGPYIWFLLYLIVLAIGLLFRNVYVQAIELNPFAFIYAFFDDPLSIFTTLINVVGFIPAYPLLYCMKRNIRFSKTVIIFGLISILIEFIQYIFARGVFSLSDVLLYLIGFMLGYWATRFITPRN